MTAPLIHIRPAAAADIPRLAALLALLFTQEADFTPDAARQRRALELILDNPHSGCLYCATYSGTVIGMVSLLFTISTAEGGRAAWLEDLVVDPAWRNRGIGKQLLDHAVAEARLAGCVRVTLLTEGDNHRAIRLYTRAGFARSAMTPFRLKL